MGFDEIARLLWKIRANVTKRTDGALDGPGQRVDTPTIETYLYMYMYMCMYMYMHMYTYMCIYIWGRVDHRQ